jgi:hypothetical protein
MTFAMVALILVGGYLVIMGLFHISFLSIVLLLSSPFVIYQVYRDRLIIPFTKKMKKQELLQGLVGISWGLALIVLFTYPRVEADVESIFSHGSIKTHDVFVDDDEGGHEKTEPYFKPGRGEADYSNAISWTILILMIAIPVITHFQYKRYTHEDYN